MRFDGENQSSQTFVRMQSCGTGAKQHYFIMSFQIFIETVFAKPGNTKEGSITVLLTSCLTGSESAV